MKLEDLLVMGVPGKQLKHICKIYDIKPGGKSLEHYAKAISLDGTASRDGELLVEEFTYAGKTSIRVYKPRDSFDEKFAEFNDINHFKEFLKDKYRNEIFTTGLRTPPTEEPNLFKVVEYKGKLFLSFTSLGSERRVFKNYEIIKERPQIIEHLVLHFNPFLLQTRVSSTKDKLFKEAILKVMNINEDIGWLDMLNLNDEEAEELRNILNGGLTCARHKMTEGIYDTIEVKAKPDVNLDDEVDYKDSYSDKPYRSLTCKFHFRYNNGVEEDISMKVKKDGISFNSTVSEEVIGFVINNILAIKSKTFRNMANVAEAAIM